jgi:2'-5' RNA ligase
MNLTKIQTQLRNLLMEKHNATYDYGCVMVKYNMSGLFWEDLQDRIKEEELYVEGDSHGREDSPHVTLLYGIHGDVELSEVKELCEDFEPILITFDKVGFFENDDYDVIKFTVSSSQLSDYNKVLEKLPHTDEYPDYNPHLTIAYVKKGMGKEISERFDDVAVEIESNTIEYSMVDGTFKEIKLTKK